MNSDQNVKFIDAWNELRTKAIAASADDFKMRQHMLLYCVDEDTAEQMPDKAYEEFIALRDCADDSKSLLALAVIEMDQADFLKTLNLMVISAIPKSAS
jgi:hypothetical protein